MKQRAVQQYCILGAMQEASPISNMKIPKQKHSTVVNDALKNKHVCKNAYHIDIQKFSRCNIPNPIPSVASSTCARVGPVFFSIASTSGATRHTPPVAPSPKPQPRPRPYRSINCTKHKNIQEQKAAYFLNKNMHGKTCRIFFSPERREAKFGQALF